MTSIKGSLKIQADVPEEIAGEVAGLLGSLIRKNDLQAKDLRSVLISATDDVPGGFIATAMNKAGLGDVPVFTIQQFRYQADMDRCVQIICYTDVPVQDPNHLLLGCESWGEEA